MVGCWIRRFDPLEVKDFRENRRGLWKQHRLSQKVPVSAWNNSMGTVFEIIYSKFVEHGTFIGIYLILYKFGIIWWFTDTQFDIIWCKWLNFDVSNLETRNSSESHDTARMEVWMPSMKVQFFCASWQLSFASFFFFKLWRFLSPLPSGKLICNWKWP